MEKIRQISVIALVVLALLSGTVRAAFFPKDINTYETRPAKQLPELSFESFLSGAYQSGFESALSDQVPMSQYFKKAYNELTSRVVEFGVKPLLRSEPDALIRYNNTNIYRDYMIYTQYEFDNLTPAYDLMADSYKAAMSANPETEFFFYYIESDTCCDVMTGEKNPSYEYLKNAMELDENSFGRLEINNFDEFQQYFRKTDHHWNHKGSYKGYTGMIELLGVEDEPLVPVEERNLGGSYVGTKGVGARLPSFAESPDVYFFDYPELGAVYGSEALYRDGSLTELVYSSFYGGDESEFVFDTGRADRENLLVLGDSFDNAVLKLLASHFGKTYSVDLRYYMDENGTAGLDITQYIERNNIDKVLVVGSDFLFADPTFAVRS